MKINVSYNKTQGRNNLAFCYYQKLEIRYKILLIMPINRYSERMVSMRRLCKLFNKKGMLACPPVLFFILSVGLTTTMVILLLRYLGYI